MTTTQEQKYIPYCSWDNEQFWIGQEAFGRDFPTYEEAQAYGAIFVSKAQFAVAEARYNKEGAITYDQVVNPCFNS